MYLRRTQRRRADGTTVGYVQLAHNRRVDGVTRAEVLVNLGREDELDVDGLRRLAASITRFTDGDGGGPLAGSAGEFEVTGSRPLGGAWVLDALWEPLGGGRALRGGVGARRLSNGVGRGVAARRALEATGGRSRAARGARRAALQYRCRAGAVRAGRQPRARSVLQARRRRVGLRGRAHPGPGRDGRGSGLPRDGSVGRGRRAGHGPGGGVLCHRGPAEP